MQNHEDEIQDNFQTWTIIGLVYISSGYDANDHPDDFRAKRTVLET